MEQSITLNNCYITFQDGSIFEAKQCNTKLDLDQFKQIDNSQKIYNFIYDRTETCSVSDIKIDFLSPYEYRCYFAIPVVYNKNKRIQKKFLKKYGVIEYECLLQLRYYLYKDEEYLYSNIITKSQAKNVKLYKYAKKNNIKMYKIGEKIK